MDAPLDANRIAVLIAVSLLDLVTPVPIAVNPVTSAIIVQIV